MTSDFRRGDPVGYKVWRFVEPNGYVIVLREASVSSVAGDPFAVNETVWTDGKVKTKRVVRKVPRGHVRLITPHDGGKRFVLPVSEVVAR